jgi:hypothetical protein
MALWSFFTVKDSMFFGALRSLSWMIKYPVVVHCLRSLLTKSPMSLCLSFIQGKVPDGGEIVAIRRLAITFLLFTICQTIF